MVSNSPMTQAVVVIPARGGSKGVPRKNLRRVGGQSLISRAVRAGRSAATISHVVVSTDDDEIAREAAAAGALVIARPPELADDLATSESAVEHALATLATGEHTVIPEVVVMVQCTSPFIAPADIDGTVEALLSSGADTAVTVTPFHGFIWRDASIGLAPVNHDSSIRRRRQDGDETFLETGAVYAMRAAGFRKHQRRFFGTVARYVVPRARSIEIDEPDDLGLAAAASAVANTGVGPTASDLDAIVLDFDGVFTDNGVITSEQGVESVRCDRRDGWAVGLLRKAGLEIVVLSTESNPVTSARCKKLGVEVTQALGDDKVTALRTWAAIRQLSPDRLAYVGNDTNDIPCMRAVGWPIAVADAEPAVKAEAAVVLERPGGRGALRELVGYLRVGSVIGE